MKTIHIPGLENKELKSVLAEPRKAKDTMPGKPFLSVVCGSRGSGKSSAIINLVKIYAETHFFDKVVVCSPTFKQDPKMANLVDTRYKLEIIEDVNFETIEEIIEKIKHDIKEYKIYEAYLKLWKRLMRSKDFDSFLRKCSAEEIALLEEHEYEPPHTDYEHGMPTTLIIFDDLVGNKAVYGNNVLNKFCLQHRHYLTSLCFSCQVWKGAVPKGIRNNLSLMMMFRNKSEAIKKEIADELSAYVTPEKLIEIWDYCCQEPHEFMMINMDDPKHRFRRNFNEIIMLEDK
jgi:hypothetical protein